MNDIRNAFLFGVTLFAFGWSLGECTGCAALTSDSTRNLEITAAYNIRLDRCRALGRLAESYAVYEACAKVVDREMCADYQVLCNDVKDAGAE